jgi:N-acetylmuramoyl-L-alanine amidase
VAALSLSVRDGNTQVELQRPSAAVDSTVPSAYLLRADRDARFETLNFQWAPDAADFAVNAVIETSEDPVTWSPVTQRAPLARLRHDGQLFEQSRVSFRPTRARFWRVAPEPGKSLPGITAVSATPVADATDVERLRASAPGTVVAGAAGVYQFDLGAQLPVDRLEMELPDKNTAARVEFFARRGASDSWHSVSQAAVYRLNSANGEIRSPPLEIAAAASRYWRVVVDPGGGGIGQGATSLRVGWLPQVLVFVVRGPGPFELVYGNYGAPSAEVSLESLLPAGALRAAGGSLDTLPRAITGEARPAGGAGRLLPPPPAAPWRLWLLWTVLCGGVFALAVVAWRLARQMRMAS